MVSSEDSGSRASTAFFGRPRRLGGAVTSESTGDASDSESSAMASDFGFRLGFFLNGGALSGVDGIEGHVESPWLTRVDKGSWDE